MTVHQGRCGCPCHRCIGALHFWPDVRDPIAAITACSRCLNDHTIALVSDWPIIPPPNPMLMPWTAQSDGEGAE